MRALLVEPGPAYSVADVCVGWEEGLRAIGVEVNTLNFGDILDAYTRCHVKDLTGDFVQAWTTEDAVRLAARQVEVACYEQSYDLVVIVSGFFMTPRTLQAIRNRRESKIVGVLTESPYEDDTQAGLLEYCDLGIVNDPTNLERLRQINAHVEYIPHAYRPGVHHPGPGKDDWRCDFAFCGTGYPSRVEFLEAVDWTGLTVNIAGNWRELDDDSPLLPFLVNPPMICMDNADTTVLYQSAGMSANLYRKEAHKPGLSQGWSMGPREVELAATGTFFLREPRGESDDVLGMLPSFTDSDEFGDLLRYYKARPDDREELARKARAAVADRTFKNNARQMMRRLAAL